MGAVVDPAFSSWGSLFCHLANEDMSPALIPVQGCHRMKKMGSFPQCHRPQFLYPSNGDNNSGLDCFPGINLNNARRSRVFLLLLLFFTLSSVECLEGRIMKKIYPGLAEQC